jgi:proliferating cell nuclear antigen
MYSATFPSGTVLKKIVNVLKDLVSQANLEFSEDGVSLQAMDDSHVCLMALELPSSFFEEYECDEDVNVGIFMQNLSKLLKCGDETVMLSSNESDPDVITIVMDDKNKNTDIEMKLLDLDCEKMELPEVEHDSVVAMVSDEFAKIVKGLGAIGDSITIDVFEENIKFSTKGDLGTAVITCAAEVEVNTPVSDLAFSLKYIISFSKAASLSEFVQISLTAGQPGEILFPIHEGGTLTFYLAPKIEDDMEGADEEPEEVT